MTSNKESFRVYVRVQIEEGEQASFLPTVAPFVEATRREPAALQCEAYYNEATRTVVWLESFNDVAGFIEHLANPEIQAMQPDMVPRVDIQLLRAFGAVSDELQRSLKEAGLPFETADPWPGTLRLHEALPNQPGVQSYVEMDLTDLETYRQTSAHIEAAAMKQPGVLYHRSFGIGGQRVAVLEGYADQHALFQWGTSEAFQQAAGDLGSLIAGLKVEVVGEVTGEAKDMMDGWGAVYFERLAGFSRFNR